MLFGQIEYWSPAKFQGDKGYGFIAIHHDDGHLEKFFALGHRCLFEKRPEIGDEVSFDMSDELVKKSNGYPLATNIRLIKRANFDDACFTRNPLDGCLMAPTGLPDLNPKPTDNISGLTSAKVESNDR